MLARMLLLAGESSLTQLPRLGGSLPPIVCVTSLSKASGRSQRRVILGSSPVPPSAACFFGVSRRSPSWTQNPVEALRRLVNRIFPHYNRLLGVQGTMDDVLVEHQRFLDIALLGMLWRYSHVLGPKHYPDGMFAWPPAEVQAFEAAVRAEEGAPPLPPPAEPPPLPPPADPPSPGGSRAGSSRGAASSDAAVGH